MSHNEDRQPLRQHLRSILDRFAHSGREELLLAVGEPPSWTAAGGVPTAINQAGVVTAGLANEIEESSVNGLICSASGWFRAEKSADPHSWTISFFNPMATWSSGQVPA